MGLRRLAILALALFACGGALAGCGAQDAADEVNRRVEQVRERAKEVRAEIRRVRREAGRVGERLARRVRKALEDLEKRVPTAGPATRAPSARGRTERGTIDGYLTDVLGNVDRYWTRTLADSGAPAPNVRYAWIPAGRATRSGCGATADDRAAFYCPEDDTIYVGETIAAEVYEGVAQDFPGEQAGQGRAVGDFGVAYIVAHEYAHNLQQELGFFSAAGGGAAAKPFELQADCMAGLWGNSVFRAGRLSPEDIEEAQSTVRAVGDFDYGAREHHGTPTERRDAWLLGFRSGDPSVCRHFVRP